MNEREKWVKEISGENVEPWVTNTIANCWEKEIVSLQHRVKVLEAQLAEAVRLLHTADRSAEHEWLDAYDELLLALADKGG